ncbi:MAG: carboxypeptidase regulatory-like domain-containing protein, partial [Anaerolineales bacterium]
MNNSWGYTGGGNPIFEAIISTLNAAGILVEASTGGSGPSCATLASPGDYLQVLTTGSVNHLGGELPGDLSPFSSRGPSMLYPDAFKPNILAPGQNIRSSIPGNAYESWSGTSMAGPHATALVGLMWSACPAYQGLVEDTFEIIHSTAVPLTGQGDSNCGGDYETGPNNDWGYGTIDALAAVYEILSLCGPQGYLEGYVIDSTDLTPITGATVTADWQDGGSWEQITGEDGYYLFEIPAGLYDVTAEHPHYTSQMVMDVEVLEDTVTVQDFSLQAKGLLWGYVTDYDNAFTLEGVIVSTADGTWAETDTYGYYEIYLDEGTYDVTATLQAYAPGEATVNIISGEETQQDFVLVAAVVFIPTPLHVTVPWQNEYSQEVELVNRLPWDYDFEFVELPDSDVPWFDQDPLEGTVPAEDSIFPLMFFSATYDAGVNQPGDYTCTLSVMGDPPLYVPVTMTVPPPDTMGQLHGTILNNCTGKPVKADIYIEDGDPIDATQSDKNTGYFTVWLYPGDYELTFSADDYLDFVVTVTIVAQESVELDVNLVPERPCAFVFPDEIEVWVPYGTDVYQHPSGLDITNNGGQSLEFTLWELPDLGLATGGGDISSLSGSIVTFDPSVGGDESYIPGTTQTFCFEAKSHSPDWEYALSVWQKFPSDWEISDVYVQGTPSCTSDGTWGTFSWSFLIAPYEVRIDHPRYHASGGDTCTAYYCFEVTTSMAGIEAPVSWYWNGDNWGSPPYNPCSDDGYTPSGQPACDEAINPVAGVPIGVMDVPWFWQDPESGLVPPVYMSNVDILFTALNEDSDPMPTGEYTATLIVVHNDPTMGPIYIPVTMQIVIPEYGLELIPEFDAQSGDPGEKVEYTLTLTNRGNALDTFELTFEGNLWVVHMPETSFDLAAGESADVIVHVSIPAEAEDGDLDMVTITATSMGDEQVVASSTLTTTAVMPAPDWFFLYTPLVVKN